MKYFNAREYNYIKTTLLMEKYKSFVFKINAMIVIYKLCMVLQSVKYLILKSRWIVKFLFL